MPPPFQIVPWYNINEWHKVYNEIFGPTSTNITKQKGLDNLLIWKARCPTLPSGIESTLTLLEVHLQDINKYETSSDNLMRLAYSSAIMRFVNHMADIETAKGLNLFRAAKNIGIPDWIIELRHDTAHSDRLPVIEQLREACLTSLEWLQKNYWNKHQQFIEDFVVEKVMSEHNDDLENKVEVLINYCISLSICFHSGCKIKTIVDIEDDSMRESLINDTRDLFGNIIDLSDLKSVTIHKLFEALNTKARRLFSNTLVSNYVNKTLLTDDCLFLSLELHNLLDNSNNELKDSLSKQYVECFERLLRFLHTNDLLLDFVLELIKYTQSEENDRKKCRLAAHWVSVILSAWCKNQQFEQRLKKTAAEDIIFHDRKYLKTLYLRWYPNERNSNLFLDLHKSVPKEITNIAIIQPIISVYNSNLTYFISDLLHLVRPCLPEAAILKICRLAKIVACPEKFPVQASSKIYTAKDIKPDYSNEEVEIVDSPTKVDETEAADVQGSQKTFGIWRIATRSLAWTPCPIGRIPSQDVQLESMET